VRTALEPPPGVVSDETTYSTPGYYVDANHVRFWRGKAQTAGGWLKFFATALTGVCRNALAWFDRAPYENVAFGTTEKLYVHKDGTLYDITPDDFVAGNVDTQAREDVAAYGVGGYGIGPYGGGPLAAVYPRTWSLANFGEWLLASPRGKGLYVWENDTSTNATLVAEAPGNIGFMLVTPQRQVLAFGAQEQTSGEYNPMLIRYCDLENINDWTATSANNAGEYVLEGGGRIVAAKLVGEYIVIWTETAVHMGYFIGEAEQTFRFDRVADRCGLASANAVIVVNNTAYWLSPSLHFWAYQVGTPPVQMPCPIRNDFADNLYAYEIDKIVTASVSKFGEIWWFYPDSRDGTEVSRYVNYSVTDNVWTRGQVARTAATDRPATYPVMVSPASVVYEHERGITADGEVLPWSIEIGEQYVNEGETRVMIRNIWPDFEDQDGDVILNFYAKDYPQATKRQKGPYLLRTGREKRDVRVEGRLIGAKFSNGSDGAYMRLGRPILDVVPTGRR
jgi:hypothetical protein